MLSGPSILATQKAQQDLAAAQAAAQVAALKDTSAANLKATLNTLAQAAKTVDDQIAAIIEQVKNQDQTTSSNDLASFEAIIASAEATEAAALAGIKSQNDATQSAAAYAQISQEAADTEADAIDTIDAAYRRNQRRNQRGQDSSLSGSSIFRIRSEEKGH